MKITNCIKALFNLAHFPFKRRMRGKTYNNKTIVLDWNDLEDCTLHNCTLIYMGFGSLRLSRSNFVNSTFLFEGPAGLGIEFAKQLGGIQPDILDGIGLSLKGAK